MDFGTRCIRKVNIFVLNSHNKLQIMLIKNKIFLWKHKTTAFWQKKHGKNTAFWQNHSIHSIWWKSRFQWFPCFRDYLLSLITTKKWTHGSSPLYNFWTISTTVNDNADVHFPARSAEVMITRDGNCLFSCRYVAIANSTLKIHGKINSTNIPISYNGIPAVFYKKGGLNAT